jgi:tripartite-type tricarboxylate transporter receptor subunit TctC
MPPIIPHIRSGRVRAVAVTTEKRAAVLPDVPTIAESGVPGYEYGTWYGLIAPAAVPGNIIDQINKAAVAVLKTPEVRQRYESQGLDPIPSTSAHYAAYLRSETDKWVKVVRDAKIELQ